MVRARLDADGTVLSDTGSLRVTWETREAAGPAPAARGTFRVIVHSDVSGRSLGVAVDARGDGRDTVYFNEDPRPFFLSVESENIGDRCSSTGSDQWIQATSHLVIDWSSQG